MVDEIKELKDSQISAKIPGRVKDEMRNLVKKGMFESLSDCTRTALYRLLKEIGDFKDSEEKKHKRILEDGRPPDMDELKKFVDDLGDLYK